MIAKHGGKFRDRLQQAYDIAYLGYRYNIVSIYGPESRRPCLNFYCLAKWIMIAIEKETRIRVLRTSGKFG